MTAPAVLARLVLWARAAGRVRLSPEAVVAAAWAVLATLLLAYLVRFGVNAPYQDEWFFTPVAVGDEAAGPWLFARHNEHVYPLGRLVYWAATRATGDFRAGAYLSVGLLTAVSLAVVLAARRIRGRSHPADVLAPAVLLHWGHFEQLMFGYQVVLTLPLAAEAAVLLLLLRLPGAGLGRTAVGVGLLLLVVLQGGGFGMAAVPPVAAWLAAAAVALVRRRELVPACAAAGLAAASVAATAVAMATAGKNEAVAAAPGWVGRATVSLHYLGSGMGPAVTVRGLPVPWAGLAVFAGHGWALVLLARAARARPGEFFRAAGLAALLATNLLIAAGLGMTRENGYAPRYAAPAAVGLVAVALTVLLYGPPVPRRWSAAAGVAAVGLAAWIVTDNARLGRYAGQLRRFHYRMLDADARAGMPPAYLGSKHADHLFFPDYLLGTYLEPLVRHRVGPFRFVPPDPPATERPVPAAVTFPARADGPPPAAALWAGEPRRLAGVRVRFAVGEPEPFLLLTLRWGEDRSATVYRRPGSTRRCSGWTTR